MKQTLKTFFAAAALTCAVLLPALAQVENVPVNHPVYLFLKRLEVKGLLRRYQDAVLPLARDHVANYLGELEGRRGELTTVEQQLLDEYRIEFEYDITRQTQNLHSLIDSREETFGGTLREFMSEKEKFLYCYADSSVSFFVDGLLTIDARRSRGDALGSEGAAFVQAGGRLRGTLHDHLGFYLQGTNAQFWGSREVLRRDKYIGREYTLDVMDAQNFDHVEGYVRFSSGIVSAQVGRERVLWGTGYGDKLVLSDNVRQFDFIRAEAEYKSFKYTFLHAWLLGKRSTVLTWLPSDPSYTFVEPVNADKYFAAHRFGLSFPSVVDVGFQEMVIYSNRSPDLAYLNPVTLIESAQRAREERDNVLWAFDARTRFMKNLEVHAAVMLDDLNFPRWGTGSVQNKNAFQVGALAVDPFGVENTSWFVEYTRIEPYMFSHQRSRDDDYGSGGRILGHHIGPNSDSWFFRLDWQVTRSLITSARYEFQREGNNIYDLVADTLVKNVGGDFQQPHRSGKDPDSKEFLGGDLVKTHRVQFLATYELVNEVFLDGRYELIARRESLNGSRLVDHDFGIALRVDF